MLELSKLEMTTGNGAHGKLNGRCGVLIPLPGIILYNNWKHTLVLVCFIEHSSATNSVSVKWPNFRISKQLCKVSYKRKLSTSLNIHDSCIPDKLNVI